MDKFVAWSDAAGLVMSYYDATNMPEGKLAQQYTLADNFFHAAFGGSFLNHHLADLRLHARLAERARRPWSPSSTPTACMIKDGSVTPDGYVVNTVVHGQHAAPGEHHRHDPAACPSRPRRPSATA